VTLRRVLFPGCTDTLRLRSGALVRYVDGAPLDPVTEADAAWMLCNWGTAMIDAGEWAEPAAETETDEAPVVEVPAPKTRARRAKAGA
jgi:hypothetical protein